MPKDTIADKVSRADSRLLSHGPISVDASCVAAFLQSARLAGRDPAAILSRAGLPADAADDPQARFDGRQFQRLLHTIQGELNDIFFGFMATPGKFGLDRERARVRLCCATMGEALRVSTQFTEAVRSDIAYQYIDDAESGEFTLGVDYRTIPGTDREVFLWLRLLIIYRYYCFLTGRPINLRRVGFAGPRPERPEALKRYEIFGCEVLFDKPGYTLTFDKTCLHFPVVRTEDEHRDWLINDPDIFHIFGTEMSLKSQTERVISRLQSEGVWSPTIAMVGAMLSVDARSLRNQLSKEQTTFSEIKARLRCEVSVAFLLTTDLPIVLIAERVGFNEPGDFTRAFINWTGLNPTEYRATYGCDKALIATCSARVRQHRIR